MTQSPLMREQLERIVQEMISKGILYDDARREFERRFISGALAQSRGSLSRASKMLGMHRNTLSRKLTEYRIRKKSA